MADLQTVSNPDPGSPTASPRAMQLQWIATAVLLLLGLAYLANGLKTLLAANFDGDLTTRWRERSYLLNGVDPYDVSVQFKGMTPNAGEARRIAEHHLQIEPALDPSGYPPFGLAASFLFIPPGPFRFVQVIFAALCVASLGVAIANAFMLGRKFGHAGACLLAATIFAMFGNASTLRLGQYGLILNALLIASLWAYQSKRPITSGATMAVAAIKPNFSALQILLMIFRRQWIAIAIVVFLCVAASFIPTLLTGVSPIELTRQMLSQSAYVSDADTSLLRIARLFASYPVAVTGLGIAGLLTTAALGWRYRHASPLVAISVAAVMGRLCLYHRQYDNVMLMFPLLALGLIALNIRGLWMWIVFAVYGFTLWAPIPYLAYRPPVIAGLAIVWIGGLGLICVRRRDLGTMHIRT